MKKINMKRIRKRCKGCGKKVVSFLFIGKYNKVCTKCWESIWQKFELEEREILSEGGWIAESDIRENNMDLRKVQDEKL